MLNRKIAKGILKKYEGAWVHQDVNMILSIFAKNWVYHEKVFEKPFRGHKEISKYWENNICNDQSNIKFRLLNFFICGNTIIAEWEAKFHSNKVNSLIRIREAAILEIRGQKIKSLREYWHEKKDWLN